MSSSTLYIVDGSSFIYRAYFAIRQLSTTTGIITNAVYGFATMLLKLRRERSPSHLCIAFDRGKPSFRREIYAEYKANRPPPPDDLRSQFPLVRELVQAFAVPILEEEGYEADDLIGALTKDARARGWDVVVVGSDKDLMQLVDENVRLYDTLKDREFGPEEVRAKFGVEPAQMIELLGLSGDTSDNIPGVPGIGDKTAAQLLGTYSTIEGVLENVDQISGAKRKENLRTYGDQARLSRELAIIRTDAPLKVSLDELNVREPDRGRLHELLSRLEFHSLLAELGFDEPLATQPAHEVRTETLSEIPELEAWISRCRAAGSFALQVFAAHGDPLRSPLVGLALCAEEGVAAYLPIDHRYLGVPSQLAWDEVRKRVGPLLEARDVAKLTHDAKRQMLILAQAGVDLEGVDLDTMVAAYLLDPSKPSFSIDELARAHLGGALTSAAEIVGKGKSQVGFDEVEIARAAPYAGEVAEATLRLARSLRDPVREADLLPLLRDLELPLVGVLARMERAGIRVDLKILAELSARFTEIARRAESEIHELAETEFNINSPKQLQEVLFGKLGLKPIKKTQTGYSTDSAVLEELARVHPMPEKILEYRSITKLKSTYVDALPQLVHPKTGRIHTSFNQAVAATGRLSSSDPNLQNIPVRTELGREIRRAFVADPGACLLSADYSQIELRILAHVSDDPTLQDVFRHGDDIHARTAAEVLGVPRDEVTAEQRNSAKAINFGIIYGMGAFRLSRELSIPQKQAQAYIDSYFARMPAVKGYIEHTLELARSSGYVRTLFGRRRFLPDLRSKNRNLRAAAERIATNTPIQGSAADLIKKAMVSIDHAIREAGLRSRMLLQVHDELVFEVPEDEVETMSRVVRDKMENVAELKVPLTLELRTGENWAEAH